MPSPGRGIPTRAFGAFGVLVLVVVGSAAVRAQDSHYWSMQFGPRPSLLSGAVIGSVEDITATYYNPGALAVTENLSFALSANVLEVKTVKLENRGGLNADLGSSRTRIRPSLIAGVITRQILDEDDVLAYSLLTRTRGHGTISTAVVPDPALIPPEENLQHLAGLVYLDSDYSDVWGGVSWGFKFGQKLGLGLSWFGAVRNQDRRQEILFQTIGDDGRGRTAVSIDSGKYYAARMLLKLGAMVTTGPFSGGISVTTPSLHVLGKGEMTNNQSITSPDQNELNANVQTDLDAEYRSPLSVGAGAAWRIGNSRLHASAEWFATVDPYTVMQGEMYQSQQPQTEIRPDVVQAQDSVVNWGLGLEHRINERWNAYVSYSMDRSSRPGESERADLSLSNFDIQTVGVGADFEIGTARFTLGGTYAWGRNTTERYANLIPEVTEGGTADVVYSGLGLLFGFEIGRGNRAESETD